MMSLCVGIALLASFTGPAAADGDAPGYLRDRGPGIRTSMFGTYVSRGELLVYPFYEFYRDNDLQYSPSEYGGVGDQDLKGRYRAHEGLIFVGYGITDRFAIELEAAYISATFDKDPADATGTPTRIEERGLGDVEGQITYRWIKESERRPEVFSFFEAVSPQNRSKALIGTPDWELKLGSGVSRGYRFGTLTGRIAVEYVAASSTPWDLGEWAVEYLRRISPRFRVYGSLEGQALDELSTVVEVQPILGEHVRLKIGTAIGLTANATDFAPELGVMFSIPTGR
jgi:hypothetical protein